VPTAIKTAKLTKSYGGLLALDNLDLEVNQGEVFGFLGPNGAGKTTTIRLLLDLAQPSAGTAEIFGLDSQHETMAAHRRLAYVPGDANLWPALTGAEVVHLLGRAQGAVDSAYRDELIERFDLDPSKRVRTYSKGNRQKVVLIAALMTRAELLILDEPTSGLDPLMEQTFRACVAEARDRGQTVFLSSHVLGEVEALCDRVAILRSGCLVDLGTLAEMRHLSAITVDMDFVGRRPDLSRVSGVSELVVEDSHIRCQVVGSMTPLLAALADVDVHHMISREPSLEELFLRHYTDGSEARGHAAS
jgi:ABC-2 type transport system ATP-binding protein